MRRSRIARCSAARSSLDDDSAIKGRRGIKAVVRVTDGVAVVADNFWRAKEALAALPVDMGLGAGRRAPTARSSPPNIARRSTARWPTAAAMATSPRPSPSPPRLVEALYEVPLSRARADGAAERDRAWRDGRVDVWMGTQAPETAIALAAKAGGVDPRRSSSTIASSAAGSAGAR